MKHEIDIFINNTLPQASFIIYNSQTVLFKDAVCKNVTPSRGSTSRLINEHCCSVYSVYTPTAVAISLLAQLARQIAGLESFFSWLACKLKRSSRYLGTQTSLTEWPPTLLTQSAGEALRTGALKRCGSRRVQRADASVLTGVHLTRTCESAWRVDNDWNNEETLIKYSVCDEYLIKLTCVCF